LDFLLYNKNLLVRAAGLEPAQGFLIEEFSYQLRLSPPRLGAVALSARLWSGLYLHLGAFAL
jgi:hypothetical protein